MGALRFSIYMLLYNFEMGVNQRVPISDFVLKTIDDEGIAAIARVN